MTKAAACAHQLRLQLNRLSSTANNPTQHKPSSIEIRVAQELLQMLPELWVWELGSGFIGRDYIYSRSLE
ncbi:hypothetical protein JZ751_020536 [Albula glossodonta]|uniref:Uncharacterized protein n=1 Tax=Albula glossodonta TaxID=121402 RepID=A0A8T2PFM0_9TELE|nr:hypothetical protein JZ751_020536 [Albula glossodonta]